MHMTGEMAIERFSNSIIQIIAEES